MSKERDTQFAGFAKLLWEQLETSIQAEFGFYPEGKKLRTKFLTMTRRLIARRAYELVSHACFEISDLRGVELSDDEMIKMVSDMTTWPEETSRNE